MEEIATGVPTVGTNFECDEKVESDRHRQSEWPPIPSLADQQQKWRQQLAAGAKCCLLTTAALLVANEAEPASQPRNNRGVRSEKGPASGYQSPFPVGDHSLSLSCCCLSPPHPPLDNDLIPFVIVVAGRGMDRSAAVALVSSAVDCPQQPPPLGCSSKRKEMGM